MNLRQLVAVGACLRFERERTPNAQELATFRTKCETVPLIELASLVQDETNAARLELALQIVAVRTGDPLELPSSAPGFPAAVGEGDGQESTK